MKQLLLVITILVLIFLSMFFIQKNQLSEPALSQKNNHSLEASEYEEHETDAGLDNDWFMVQRSYPKNVIPQNALTKARKAMRTKFSKRAPLQNDWTLAGPTNIGGRITAIIIHPTDPNTIYAGSASGGVWKTTNLGQSWENIFNESFSIGSLAFAPNNPDIIYVGTGEANPAGVATYPGNGIWKSTDAGVTWVHKGLELTGYIGKIAIRPDSVNTMFVAALGLYRSMTQERGIYKSTNGGDSWNRILFIDDTTCATDVVINPTQPNIVLAAMWARYRTPQVSTISGVTSGLYISHNGGTSWDLVTSGFPSFDPNLGRVSLDISRSNNSIAYALAANGVGWGGVYKSTDYGDNWTKVYDGASQSQGQVWYDNVITIHPTNPNFLWAGMTSIFKSTDGGASFSIPSIGAVHVDHHAMAYSQSNPNFLVIGSDGGIFISTNGGSSFTKSYNLPITQFYAGTINYLNSAELLGGTQDNSPMRGFSTAPDNWTQFYGGDGFYCLVDPTDQNYVYTESQNGGLGYSTNAGASFNGGTNGIDGGDRKNWETPIAMSWQNPKTLYTGTHRVYRTTNNMQSWSVISNDLTYGNGGRVGTISTIDVSQTDSNVVYVGTDDGRVWVTTNGGSNWVEIDSGLPQHWVTRVTADPQSPNIAYVTFSGFIENDYASHIYRTTNFGSSWTNIGTTLPDVPINDVVVDSLNTDRLFIATDLNVMWTNDLGTTWEILGASLPEVSVHDLSFHQPTRTLAAFTHGRSVWTIEIPTNNETVTLNVSGRWNLLSLPVEPNNHAVSALFPTATSNAYRYTPSGYQQENTLAGGTGYWLKFNTAQSIHITGTDKLFDSIYVSEGWNLIGSISVPVQLNSIITEPPGIISSSLFRFENGYQVDSTISPGKAYWIKVNQSGTLYLGSAMQKQ